MSFNFNLDIWPGTDMAKTLARLKQKAEESSHDIVISGNTSSGSIRGAIEGSYQVNGEQIHFTITKKPTFATEGMIKDELKRFF